MAPFDSSRFERLLETRAIGRDLVYRLSVDSTMALARELASAGAPHGTAVLAEEQTAGRGRRGRSFQSPAGENIYVTLVLLLAAGTIGRLPLAVPTAVCAAIEAESVPARIKWPNDIWIDGRKACGMLIDLDDTPGGFVAFPGIGVNVNGDPTLIPELRDTATSIRLAAGRPIDREALLARMCNNLEAALESWDAERLSAEYRACSLVLGQRVTVSGHGAVLTGIAAAVLDDGSLQIRRDDGSTESVNAGDVSLRPA